MVKRAIDLGFVRMMLAMLRASFFPSLSVVSKPRFLQFFLYYTTITCAYSCYRNEDQTRFYKGKVDCFSYILLYTNRYFKCFELSTTVIKWRV